MCAHYLPRSDSKDAVKRLRRQQEIKRQRLVAAIDDVVLGTAWDHQVRVAKQDAAVAAAANGGLFSARTVTSGSGWFDNVGAFVSAPEFVPASTGGVGGSGDVGDVGAGAAPGTSGGGDDGDGHEVAHDGSAVGSEVTP